MRKHPVTQSESGRWNCRGDGVKAAWRLSPASGLRRRDTQAGRPVMAGGSPFRVMARFLLPGFGWPGGAAGIGGGPKPTIVLEHGAWADSGSWGAVIQRLQADGYTVDARPNPLQGLAYDPACR